MKGKGKMATYFLCGHLQRRMEELADDFAALEVYRDTTENGEYVVGPSGFSQDDLVSLDVNGDKNAGQIKRDEVDTTFDDDDDDDDEISGDEEADEEENATCDEEDLQSDHTVDEKTCDVEKGQIKKRRESEGVESMTEKVESAKRKISSQSLASGSKYVAVGGPKLKRGNRKISRSCNDTTIYSTSLTLPHDKAGHRSASENEIVTSAKNAGDRSRNQSKTGEGDDNECIYVNGSFKNAYRSAQHNDKENSVDIPTSKALTVSEDGTLPRRDGCPQSLEVSEPAQYRHSTTESLTRPTVLHSKHSSIRTEPSEVDMCSCSVYACKDSTSKVRNKNQVYPSGQAGASSDNQGNRNGVSLEAGRGDPSCAAAGRQAMVSPDRSLVSIYRPPGSPTSSVPSSLRKSESSPAAHVTWGPFPEGRGSSMSHRSMECLGTAGERASTGGKKGKKKKKSKSPSKLCSLS